MVQFEITRLVHLNDKLHTGRAMEQPTVGLRGIVGVVGKVAYAGSGLSKSRVTEQIS